MAVSALRNASGELIVTRSVSEALAVFPRLRFGLRSRPPSQLCTTHCRLVQGLLRGDDKRSVGDFVPGRSALDRGDVGEDGVEMATAARQYEYVPDRMKLVLSLVVQEKHRTERVEYATHYDPGKASNRHNGG